MNNRILIVDDDHEHADNLAYFFRLLDEERGEKFDILGRGQPRRPCRLVPYRQDCPVKFLKFFEAAHFSGRRYPLCIVDMIMKDESGLLDQLRGVTVSRRVREIDPEIHIVIATIKPDLDGEAICREVGGSTHFFQTPFFSPEQEEAFVLKVHGLVDEWNGRH